MPSLTTPHSKQSLQTLNMSKYFKTYEAIFNSPALTDPNIFDTVFVITESDGPFRPMPEETKRAHPEWITASHNSITVVLNNVFTFPSLQPNAPKTILRLATQQETASLKPYEITNIYFMGNSILHRYVPCTRLMEVVIHPDLQWLQRPERPTVLIYHPASRNQNSPH